MPHARLSLLPPCLPAEPDRTPTRTSAQPGKGLNTAQKSAMFDADFAQEQKMAAMMACSLQNKDECLMCGS
eukprot:1159294-Pelagomonas_calceolata.AAC.1